MDKRKKLELLISSRTGYILLQQQLFIVAKTVGLTHGLNRKR